MRYNRIKEVLNEQGRKQAWLAQKMSVSKITVSKWCRNEDQPHLTKLHDIAECLGVSTKDLVTDKPLPETKEAA